MKLEEFVSFKTNCFVCNAKLNYKLSVVTNYIVEPLHVFVVAKSKVLKLQNDNITIFVNLTHNNFILKPNKDADIELSLKLQCSKSMHYEFVSEPFILNYKRNVWTNIPAINLIEYIETEDSFISNAYSEENEFTWIDDIDHPNPSTTIEIPLITTKNTDFNTWEKTIKTYLAFA